MTSSEDTAPPSRVHIDRPVVTQTDVERIFSIDYHPPATWRQFPAKLTDACCSATRWKNYALSRFPIVNLLRGYEWKNWILWDILAGINVGMVHIPQSMGFSLLAQLPPVYGLYTTIFQILVYLVFGTSRHISVGTMAVPSILLGTVVNSQTALRVAENVTSSNGTVMVWDELSIRVDVATSVTLLVGVFQVCMGVLGLSVITRYMSSAFISAFLVGVTCIILTSQAAFLLGLSYIIPLHTGFFRLALTWYDVFRNIRSTNIAELVCSIISLTTLIVIKMVINEKFKHKLKIPIPAEMLVLVTGILVSHFCNLQERYGMRVVGYIPKGIPTPRAPSMENARVYVADAFVIAIVSFTISITMAKVLSRKHRYRIDDTQEMLAYGLGNLVCSFLNSFAGNQAPPRTLVHEATGGKTQLASIVSASMVLTVCLFLGPYIQVLPNAVLASIITIALLPMFTQFRNLAIYWKVNKMDIVIWVVTLLLVIIVDIVVGLGVGIGLGLLFVVLETSLTKGSELQTSREAEGVYVGGKTGPRDPRLLEGNMGNVRIFGFNSLLFFANIDGYKAQIMKLAGVETAGAKQAVKEENPPDKIPPTSATNSAFEIDTDNGKPSTHGPDHVDLDLDADNGKTPTNGHLTKNNDIHKSDHITNGGKAHSLEAQQNGKQNNTTRESRVEAIICDCSAVTYIDILALNTLKEINGDLKEAGVRFVLSACKEPLLKKLQAAEYPPDTIYPTVHDAVCALSPTEPSTTEPSTRL